MTFFQATFVLVTFVHIKNISDVNDFDETLKVDFWEYLEQIPTVTEIFVLVKFVAAIFVHISIVTDTIWTKL